VQESSQGTFAINAPTQHVQWLLDYVHGSLKSIEMHMAVPLFQLADEYGMQGLEQACKSCLVHNLCADTVPALLQLSDMHNCDALLEACVSFVRSSGCVPVWLLN
jgi:hypothetical protein